ncbi:hypothetical protein OF83DRAFT_1163608 [Amylostereum chailletii]|nr:hypothetical protein OF83DRAFT_1163608 [Amylostereum chailletii]
MYSGSAASWLQQTQQPQQPTLAQDPSSSTASGAPASSPGIASTPIDLTEFFAGDMSASTQGLSQAPAYFNNFANSNNIFFSSQYNGGMASYPHNSWTMSQTQVPLSTYSTLNGATTSNSPAQTSSQSPSHPTVIDPALTINNASTSYSPSPSIAQPQPVQHSASSSQQYNQYSHISPSALSIPAYMQSNSNYHHSPTQSSAQSTTSPYTAQLMSAIPPSSFYSNHVNGTQSASSSTSAAPSPVQSRKERLLEAIMPALATSGFVGEAGLRTLVSHIAEYGVQKVDASTRLDVTNKIRDKAGNDYFQAWLKDATAMDITREWLKASATSSDSQVHETAMPLLHLVDRLPFTAESLVSSKLGRIVRKMAKDSPIPAVKDMASNLERRWRERFVDGTPAATPPQPMNVDEQPQVKKRKSSSAPSTKAALPTKKLAVASASSSKPVAVKREAKDVKPLNTTMKESKSDMSFFSAPKPKPKLPSFKKAPVATVKKEQDANIAQPSAINPFQEAMKDMAKQRRLSPATTAPTPSSSAAGKRSATPTGLTKSGKPKKSVTWAPDGQLERGSHSMHTLRDLDRGEGAALHAHLFEEVLDWFEPNPVELEEDRIRGSDSQEKVVQEQREATALGAMYLSAAQIPDSPAEPSTQLSQEQVDAEVRVMFSGAELEGVVSQYPPSNDTQAEPAPSVSDLVGQLAGMDQHQLAEGVSRLQADPNMVAQLTPEQLQHVMQLLGMTPPVAPAQDASVYAAAAAPVSQGWPSETSDYYAQQQQQYSEPTGDRHSRWPQQSSESQWSGGGGGGGRGGFGRGGGRGGGRGRGKSRVPCSFFAQGRCKFGDQCDFGHELGTSNYG